jgi:iron complex outermembrane recepter protein
MQPLEETNAMTRLLVTASALPMLMMAGLPAAHAQSAASSEAAAEDTGIVDIVVTAQRRAESSQSVPIAITALSGDQLSARSVSSTLDLGQFVPNLVAQNNTGLGSANAFYLRGLGNTETIPTFDPPVGTYVDDIYLSRQNANNLALFDVERVEVLRGPQGTLFGRNTTGGAISLILKKPEFDKVGGYAEAGYGSYDKKLVRASIDLPLAPTFAIKLSGYWQDDKGYVRNATTNEMLNDDDGWGVRLGLRGELSSSVRWNGSYAHIVANGENILNFDCNPATPSMCKGRYSTTGLRSGGEMATSPYGALAISGRKKNYGLGNYTQTDLITSELEIDIAPETTLSFITGYVATAQQYALDFADGRATASLASPNPPVRGYTTGGFTIINDGKATQFSHEVKLNGQLGDGLIDYVVGGYFIDESNTTDFADLFALSPVTTLVLADRTLKNTVEAYAGYAQVDVNVTEQITLTAGVRYTDETKTLRVRDNRATCAVTPLPTTCLDSANLRAPSGLAIPASQTARLWTPRFAVNFKPQDNILLFASATRGFKSGGWNARGTATNTFLPFGPEKVWSYEAGIKSDLFDRKVRANITFYVQDTADLQTPSALVNPTTGAITFLTRNFADYQNKGIEAEFQFRPMPELNLYVTAGYQDDKYKVNSAAAATDIYGIQSVTAQLALCKTQLAAGLTAAGSGANNAPACGAGIVAPDGSIAEPVRTPDFTLALGGSYDFAIGSGLTLTPSLNGSYRTAMETGTSNVSIYAPGFTSAAGTVYGGNTRSGTFITGSDSPANWIINASIALASESGWSLTADCNNCLNKTVNQSSLANYTYLNRPRVWTVRAKYRF